MSNFHFNNDILKQSHYLGDNWVVSGGWLVIPNVFMQIYLYHSSSQMMNQFLALTSAP